MRERAAETLIDLLDDGASDGRATLKAGTGERISFGDLWRAADVAGHALRHQYGDSAVLAGILTPAPECIATLLGALRWGHEFVSLPLPARGMSSDHYAGQIRALIRSAGCAGLLVEDTYLSLLAGVGDVGVPAQAYEISSAPGSRAVAHPRAGTLVQFTSGTVGTPKGIRLDCAMLAANISAILDVIEPRPGATAFSWLPLSHDMGLVGMLLSSLCAPARRFGARGTQVFLMRPEKFLSDPASWVSGLSEVGATVTATPNFGLDLAVRRSQRVGSAELGRLQACIIGGERVRPTTLRTFAATFAGSGLREIALCPAYGLAEAGLAVSITRPEVMWSSRRVDRDQLVDESRWRETDTGVEFVSNGLPIGSVEVCTEGGPGHVGTVLIRGGSVIDSYTSAPVALTADGWLRTGDDGVLCSDGLYVTGRHDDRLVVRGRNLDAVELEQAVSAVPDVRPGACAVVEEGGALVVLAEPRSSSADLYAGARSIRKAVSQLAGLAPSRVVWITPGSLAKTPSGKLRRRAAQEGISAADSPVVLDVVFRLDGSS